jgi:hypothetical protein
MHRNLQNWAKLLQDSPIEVKRDKQHLGEFSRRVQRVVEPRSGEWENALGQIPGANLAV